MRLRPSDSLSSRRLAGASVVVGAVDCAVAGAALPKSWAKGSSGEACEGVADGARGSTSGAGSAAWGWAVKISSQLGSFAIRVLRPGQRERLAARSPRARGRGRVAEL